MLAPVGMVCLGAVGLIFGLEPQPLEREVTSAVLFATIDRGAHMVLVPAGNVVWVSTL